MSERSDRSDKRNSSSKPILPHHGGGFISPLFYFLSLWLSYVLKQTKVNMMTIALSAILSVFLALFLIDTHGPIQMINIWLVAVLVYLALKIALENTRVAKDLFEVTSTHFLKPIIVGFPWTMTIAWCIVYGFGNMGIVVPSIAVSIAAIVVAFPQWDGISA